VLRSAARIDRHQHAPGTLSLVRELLDEGRPRGIVDRLRQPPSGQSFDSQVLDRDEPESIDERSRQLVLHIRPLVPDVGLEPPKRISEIGQADQTDQMS
jgi:hypothetical protein